MPKNTNMIMLNQLLIIQEQNGRENRNTLISTHEQNYYDIITTKIATTILQPHLLLYIKNPKYIGSIKVAYARAQLLIIHQVKVQRVFLPSEMSQGMTTLQLTPHKRHQFLYF